MLKIIQLHNHGTTSASSLKGKPPSEELELSDLVVAPHFYECILTRPFEYVNGTNWKLSGLVFEKKELNPVVQELPASYSN